MSQGTRMQVLPKLRRGMKYASPSGYIESYRGYLLTHNPISDEWYASKDGFVIGTGTRAYLKAAIDEILD